MPAMGDIRDQPPQQADSRRKSQGLETTKLPASAPMLGAPRKSPASGAVLTDHSPPCMRRRVCRLWGWRGNIGIHRWLRRLAGYVCHASHRVHLSPDWVLRRPTLAAAMCQAPASCLPCCKNCGTGPRIRRPRGYCHRCDNCRGNWAVLPARWPRHVPRHRAT